MTPNDVRRQARVLFVDDEESVRALVDRALGSSDYQVVLADSGEAALRAIGEQKPFDLYIFDFMMPAMRGDELAQRLRASQPGAKVLFFTGQSERLLEDRQSASLHEAFIDKPLSLSVLREAVSLMLFGSANPPR
jgi:two-component system cell cycle sensor histidine kinase/response regulator CckA